MSRIENDEQYTKIVHEMDNLPEWQRKIAEKSVERYEKAKGYSDKKTGSINKSLEDLSK